MGRYKIWDKQSDIYTLGKDENGKNYWTAQEYIRENAPWANSPNVKVIVSDSIINGLVFMEFYNTVEHYKRLGVNIEDGMSDREVLDAIQAWEDTQGTTQVSPEERIAAALEFQNLLSM